MSLPEFELELVKWSWTMLLLPIGWIFKLQLVHKDRCDVLHREHVEHREHIAENYVLRTEVHIMDERIFRILQRIEDKIDGKVDK